MIHLSIPEIPVGPNSSPRKAGGRKGFRKGLFRMHWAERKQYWERWRSLVREQLPFCPERRKVKVTVKIHQVRPALANLDNLYGSAKPVLDALASCGLIWNDSPYWIDLECTQERGSPERTEITIG